MGSLTKEASLLGQYAEGWRALANRLKMNPESIAKYVRDVAKRKGAFNTREAVEDLITGTGRSAKNIEEQFLEKTVKQLKNNPDFLQDTKKLLTREALNKAIYPSLATLGGAGLTYGGYKALS
jgi:hypothetical protein